MLKQGTKLVGKSSGENYHIGCVLGELYLLVRDKDDTAWSNYTHSELLKGFNIVKEDWQPKIGERYYFRNGVGVVDCNTWDDNPTDHFRRDYMGIHPTAEEVPMGYKSRK